jgi:hypothetical protein
MVGKRKATRVRRSKISKVEGSRTEETTQQNPRVICPKRKRDTDTYVDRLVFGMIRKVNDYKGLNECIVVSLAGPFRDRDHGIIRACVRRRLVANPGYFQQVEAHTQNMS